MVKRHHKGLFLTYKKPKSYKEKYSRTTYEISDALVSCVLLMCLLCDTPFYTDI